ncbi:uncharacterized protein LOC111468025 [Cucurbita maxima]|uniref:Uncharacterized protein LOC111468025 n=1 Tax=Cucurbita maxima TaxID=3661 RepID=A0A6J1HZC1_CUCMA|nr:uncharacterized protein LOC111468025 [Cucurbita maxima]
MAKEMLHVESGGGNVKKRMMKRRRKKKNIHKVIDYLLSDCNLFAPLISPSPFNSYRAPRKGSSFISDIEIRERPKDHRSFLKKMVDYLKSDCYMYASLVAPQSFRGRAGYVKRVVTTEVSARRLILRGDEVMSESAANMTKERRICSTDLMEAEVVVDQQNATTKEPPFSLHVPATRCSVRHQNTPRPTRMAS